MGGWVDGWGGGASCGKCDIEMQIFAGGELSFSSFYSDMGQADSGVREKKTGLRIKSGYDLAHQKESLKRKINKNENLLYEVLARTATPL